MNNVRDFRKTNPNKANLKTEAYPERSRRAEGTEDIFS